MAFTRLHGQDAISRPLIDNWQRSVLSNGFFTWTFGNVFFASTKSGWCEGRCKQKHSRHQQTRYVCVNQATRAIQEILVGPFSTIWHDN